MLLNYTDTKQFGSSDPDTERALRYMFSARREYLEVVFASIENKYGGFKGFLIEGLGLMEEDITRMRYMYLGQRGSNEKPVDNGGQSLQDP